MDRLDRKKAELDKKLAQTDLTKAVEALFKEARRSKIRQIVLTISVILDLVLTVGLFQAYHRIDTNREYIKTDCYSRNESRANNKEIWGYLLAVPPEKPRTSIEQKFFDEFKQKIDDTFAPKDCTKI